MHKGNWGTDAKCSHHVRNYAILIQSVWRMYAIRKKINLFKKLPDDIWSIVMKHIEYKNNIINLLRSHQRIYINRKNLLKKHPWWAVDNGVTYYRRPDIYNRCILAADTNIGYFQDLIK
tara:strand:+ start:468 stop:824 length:357 start_codon:yes stop_codon:yes gene_type:complete